MQQRNESDRSFNPKAKRKQSVNTINTYRNNERIKISNNCLLHQNSNHLTRKCKSFLSKTCAERGKPVKELDACKLCLSLSHVGKPCPWESKWNPCNVDGCGEFHPRLLHVSQDKGFAMHASKRGKFVGETTQSDTLFLIQIIKSIGNEITVFWDSGSSISLVSRNYACKNKLLVFTFLMNYLQ